MAREVKRVDPQTIAVMLFLYGPLAGPPTAVTYLFYRVSEVVGEMTESEDWEPLTFPNPPLPRWLKEKPEIAEAIKAMFEKFGR